MSDNRSLWDKFWKDDEGHVVVWQTPSIPLWTWIVSAILAKLFKHGQPHQVFMWVAFVSLIVWAGLEIFKGSSYFRRVLGLVVLATMLYSRFK